MMNAPELLARYTMDLSKPSSASTLKMERCQELVPKDPVKCLDMLNQTTNQLKHAIQEARQVIYNLRPGQYDNLDLVSALVQLFEIL